MKTHLTTSPEEAAEFIKRGGTVAFPTETVYGLGAEVFNVDALARIFAAKQRPPDNPLIVHIADIGQIRALSIEVKDFAQQLIDAFFPGPLTLVMRKSPRVPLIATAGLDTVGIRQPRFELARTFLGACSAPVAAPSANLSGRPSPTTWQSVAEDLDGRIDCILQGPESDIGLESTVVDCTGEVPLVLRSGSISIEQLRVVAPMTQLDEPEDNAAPKSPGLRHRHYSPRAAVILVEAEKGFTAGPDSAYIGLSRPPTNFAHQTFPSDAEGYAHVLFEFFRECDRRGIGTIYCEPVPENGIGAAVMDRIRRATRLD